MVEREAFAILLERDGRITSVPLRLDARCQGSVWPLKETLTSDELSAVRNFCICSQIQSLGLHFPLRKA